jgi:hypothetical protein
MRPEQLTLGRERTGDVVVHATGEVDQATAGEPTDYRMDQMITVVDTLDDARREVAG